MTTAVAGKGVVIIGLYFIEAFFAVDKKKDYNAKSRKEKNEKRK